MDVYLFFIFGSEVVETTSDKEGGMRKVGQGKRNEEGGLLPFFLFTLLPFYSFTSLRISKLLRGRCCDQACIDVLFVSPLLMCRF